MKAYDTLWGYCARNQWDANSTRLYRTSCDYLFSLRSGLTAYAVLSREPNSFWPPSLRELTMWLTRLGAPNLREKLGRSDDGQDHTVLPYARSPIATGFDGIVHAAIEMLARRTEQRRSSARGFGLTGTTRPARTISCRRCRVHRKPGSQSVTTYDRPSRMSWDGQHIRQIRISVKWNISSRRG
jgi:hypothetical protein